MPRLPILLSYILLSRAQILYDSCESSLYYADLSADDEEPPSRIELHQLLARTHRKTLPYTDNDPGDDDVWKALMDLDAVAADTVQLIYKQSNQTNADATKGVSTGWNREHLWPQSRGVGANRMEAAFVDIHHLVPADWNVNAARGNKYFNTCSSSCTRPAHPEARDTVASPTSFLPPESVRGRIARALLYMDVRYSGTVLNSGVPGRDDGVDLILTDCVRDTDNEVDQIGYMGSLTQILQWHKDYPVTEQERARNQKACERWQGNRNPFIDHEEWVDLLYELPTGDPCTSLETPAPIPADGACPRAGSLMIVGVNSDNPDTVALVAMTNIATGTKLFLTDNAWTGNEFLTNEGTLEYIVGAGGIPAGTVFGPGVKGQVWSDSTTDAGFALSATGDTVILYCKEGGDADDEIFPIAGLSLSGAWDASSESTNDSGLPESISGKSEVTLVANSDNARYTGPTSGTSSSLRERIRTASLWETSDSERFSFDSLVFNVQVDDNESRASGIDVRISFLLLASLSLLGIR